MTRNDNLLLGDLTEKVIGIFFQVHYELGFGFLESVYADAMAIALRQAGFQIEREVPIPVYFRGIRVRRFRGDMLVESKLLLDFKAGAILDPHCEGKMINYLAATDIEVGLVLHFGVKPKFKRLVYSNDRKLPRRHSA
jgi:GxxExxY protein